VRFIQREPRPCYSISTDFAAIGPAVAKLESEVGPIDVLVNNAGYGHEGILEESLVGLNKTTVRRKRIRRGRNDEGCAAVHARETRRHIVNITSMAGYVGIAHYARSMLAVECIFEALAKEVRHLGIRVTAIAPGSFRTDWAGFGARGA